MEAARDFWANLSPARQQDFRFLHVSTDKVYGDLGESETCFLETSPYRPSSPYSASKASSDHLVRAWHRTYGLPTLVTHCSNNYGPYQFREKLIPLTIMNAIDGVPLPIYGTGCQVRDWIHVDDHARALLRVLELGAPGTTYNIGGLEEKQNIEIVHAICDLLEELIPPNRSDIRSYRDLIVHVNDRPGHDFRYAIDASKIRDEVNWFPQHTFEGGLRRTVQWYVESAAYGGVFS